MFPAKRTRMRTRALPVIGVLLALVVLGGVVVAVAGSQLSDVLNPRPPEACSESDPTSSGCVTPTALRVHDAAVARFGKPGAGEPVRSITCWSEHAWNPGSDHPAGRACDFFPTRSGTFPEGDELAAGWEVANWARDNADELGVRYLIWQGRIWYNAGWELGPGSDEWGRPYNGGGVYDPDDATGGHFDHVHVSVRD